jgi:uncharacterized membrane protein YeaQ/YmgE (transglycosylase-associated protein family)
MGFISMIGVGLIAGAVAQFSRPGKDPGGLIVAILLGTAGAILAGFFGYAVGWYQPGQGAGVFGSFVGAAVILVIYRVVIGRSARRSAGREDQSASGGDVRRAA